MESLEVRLPLSMVERWFVYCFGPVAEPDLGGSSPLDRGPLLSLLIFRAVRSGESNSEGELETAGFCPVRIKNITPNYPKVVLQMFDKVKHAHLQTAAAAATTGRAGGPPPRRARPLPATPGPARNVGST